MKENKKLIKELKKEFKYQKVIVYPGPKRQFKAVMGIFISLCFIFGLGMLSTRRPTTSYTILAYDTINWSGIILMLIPLVLVLYWFRKR